MADKKSSKKKKEVTMNDELSDQNEQQHAASDAEPVTDQDDQMVAEVPAEHETDQDDQTAAEAAAKPETDRKVCGRVKVLFDGMLNIRKMPSWGEAAVAGRISKGACYMAERLIEVEGRLMYKLTNGMYITADEKLVMFEEM